MRITDFGLCRENMDAYSHTSTFCGTAVYMAPELIAESSYTRAVDWWSLGVLIFEMLVGDCPFHGDDDDELYKNILEEEIVYPCKLGMESTLFMDLLLEREPELRLGSGEEDAEEVKAQCFFNQFNFEALLAKTIAAPFVPNLKNAEDVSYFDEEFTDTSPILTPAKNLEKISEMDQKKFGDFDYQTNWTSS